MGIFAILARSKINLIARCIAVLITVAILTYSVDGLHYGLINQKDFSEYTIIKIIFSMVSLLLLVSILLDSIKDFLYITFVYGKVYKFFKRKDVFLSEKDKNRYYLITKKSILNNVESLKELKISMDNVKQGKDSQYFIEGGTSNLKKIDDKLNDSLSMYNVFLEKGYVDRPLENKELK